MYKCHHCKRNHPAGSDLCKENFLRNKTKNDFVWRFLVGQKLSPSIGNALRLKAVPIGLDDTSGEQLGDENEEELNNQDKIYDLVGDYVLSHIKPITGNIENMQLQLANHEIMIKNNTQRIEVTEACLHAVQDSKVNIFFIFII